MYVITADQIDSRHGEDLVDTTIAALRDLGADALVLPVERTAGDELQALTDDPGAAVDIVAALARTGSWSIGLGVGPVEQPLPATIRAASGPAFFRARDAVEAAKRSPEHVAVLAEPGGHRGTADVEPILALALRDQGRRDADDWAVAELLAAGQTQRDIAERLGVTQQAVSKRVRRQSLDGDRAIRDALARLLADADTDTDADTDSDADTGHDTDTEHREDA